MQVTAALKTCTDLWVNLRRLGKNGATGNKCRRTIDSAGIRTDRDYINGVEYKNSQQDIIHFTEGYIQRDPTLDNDPNWRGWLYKYTIKDHLGNTRVTFSDKKQRWSCECADGC